MSGLLNALSLRQLVKISSLAALLCALNASALEIVSPAPGVRIDNQAQSYYLLGDDPDTVFETLSNISSVTTGADYGLSLEESEVRDSLVNQLVHFPHTLTNRGNTEDSFDLTVINLADDQGELTDLVIYHDENGNGVPDGGEDEITQTPSLEPGEIISLVISGQTPVVAEVGDQIAIEITATSVGDPAQSETNMDLLTIIEGALLRFTKTSSVACNIPVNGGDTLSYGVLWTNSGDQNPVERNHVVDGVTTQGVMIEDRLPSDVKVVSGQNLAFVPFDALPVVMTSVGAEQEEWITYDSWNGVDHLTRIGLMVPAEQLRPNQSGTFVFDVTVSDNVTLNTKLENQVVVDEDGDGDYEYSSAVVCNTTNGPAAEIRFLSPTFDKILEQEAPDFEETDDFSDTLRYRFDADVADYDATFDGVYVELSSTSVPKDSIQFLEDGSRQVVVNVNSEVSGLSVPLLVRETEVGSGIYRNIVPLVLSTNESSNGNLCGDLFGDVDYVNDPPEECTLLSGEDDALTVTFFDEGLGEVIDDASIVDPLGYVFNSITLEPIEGIEVRVLNAVNNGPGGLQDELANDPFSATGEPLVIQFTDDTGFYQYPFMFAGSYYMQVIIPPDQGYAWPSRRNPLLYPGLDVSDFSYGRNGFEGTVINSGVFTLDADNPIVSIDFPVDPVELDLVVDGTVSCDMDITTDDPISYSTTFANSGTLIPPERDIFIDGVSQSGVVVEALVPINTVLDPDVTPTFSPASAELILNLYDGLDADEWVDYDTWFAQDAADRGFVRSVGLLVPQEDLEPATTAGALGEGGDLAYGVRIVGDITAGTQIINQITVDLDGDGSADILSDEDFQDACETADGPEPEIRFIGADNGGADPVFDQLNTLADTSQYHLDGLASDYDHRLDGVYVELTSTSISAEDYEILDDGRRRILVLVESSLTGDLIEKILEETEYASGIYRSIRPLVLHDVDTGSGAVCHPADGGADYVSDPGLECILNSEVNDVLTVSFLHRFEDDAATPESTLTDIATVAPIGFVFFSQPAYDPVASAIVRIYEVTGPGSSEVAVGPFATAADGSFPFPELPNGDYYIDVESTDLYAFASEANLATLQAESGYQVEAFSYGLDSGTGIFTISDGIPFEVFDVPVDLIGGDAVLVVEKTVNQNSVEIGGLLEYAVSVSNVGDGIATNVEVVDLLPFGFKYIEDTLRQDQVLIADPAGAPGPELTFAVGPLLAEESIEFRYVLQATSGALDSDGVNTAQASGQAISGPVISNEARVQVDIELSGVLSEKGIIFGKVFVDADCNNIQSQGEWPVGGIALYLEDGTYAITDENGQYSIYGINPGNHSIKIDPLTLPEGLKLKPIDNRHLADPESRLVDLVNGEFHRADFAAACPDPEEADFVYEQVAARNASIQGDWLTANSASFDRFERAAARAGLDDEDLSSGTIFSAGQLDSSALQVSPTLGIRNDVDLTATTEEEVETALVVEDIIYEVTAEEGREGMWLWPKDDISLYGRFVVAVRDRVVADLYINGEQVSRAQLGEEAHNTATDVQVLAWYGVNLPSGENLVEVKTQDMFGNERIMLSKTFVSPSQAVELEVQAESNVMAADGGRTTMPIQITVLDEAGYQARGLHYMTVEVSDGRILGADLQPDTPGFQVRLDRGTAEVILQSGNRTDELEVRVSNDNFDESVFIDMVAAQRSLLVSGIASAAVGSCTLNSEGYAPTGEECMDGLLSDRAALFMKGSVRGNLFLTLSYDSDKAGDGELLRDINPEDYYPIFGDSSVRGYEAQSRSKLYAKLEMDRSYIQWGDFATDSSTSFQDLGRVQRALTGFTAELDHGALNAQVFAAEVEDTRDSIEIPGNGTAMLFSIPAAPIVRNSEIIELVTRDRENPGLILSADNLSRFIDYSIDHISGDIRFTRTIPTVDSDLNPVSVRVSYDLEGTGGSDLVAGVRASYEVTDGLVVGASGTKDENATNGFDLSSGFVEYKPTDSARVFVSAANMEHADTNLESGNALYAEVEMTWENGSSSNMRWGRAEEGFTNTSAGVSADREELRAKHNQKLGQSLSLDAELIRSESLSRTDSRQSMELGVDYTLGEWTLSLGGRRIEQSTDANPDDEANTIRAGAGRTFVLLGRRGNANLDLEREIGEQDRKRWALGASWQAMEKLSVYGNFEQVNSLTAASALNSEEEQITANFGFESDFLPSTNVFNEYRMRGVTDGRDLEAATGVRGEYEILEGLKITPSLEWIDVLDGEAGQDSTAISIGIEDLRNQNSRTQARVESRFDEDREYYGLDLSYVARTSLDWSVFAREELSYSAIDDADNDMSHLLTLGLTHRPRETNKYHALFMYQWAEERGANLLDDTSLHLLSTHQNYQFNDGLRLSGRLGAKYETTALLDEEFSSLTAVMDARLIWDINRRFDFDVHAGVLGTNGFEETRYSLGAGISFLVLEGLRVGLGYNLVGFDEGDLDTEGYNRQGLYIHAEYKFDEDLFRWLESDLYRKEEEL